MKRLPFPSLFVVRPLAAALFTALLLSTAGAFDTEAAQFAPRLLYWIAIAGLSTFALQMLHALLQSSFDRIQSAWLRLFGWAVLTLPLNAVAVLACKLLFGGVPSLAGFLLLLPGMATILAALQFTLAAFAKAAPEPCRPQAFEETAPAPLRGRLSDLLPLPLQRARIQALKAEDHYVRIHTDAGQTLLRMRMSDAVALLAAEDGIRPHRSWWIARDAVVGLRREGARTVLQVADGTIVPVSRNARSGLGPAFRS